MTLPIDDPDDLIGRQVDYDHVARMSAQMRVPDSITVGPQRSTIPRLHADEDRAAFRMEVPDRLRPAGNGNMIQLNGPNLFTGLEAESNVSLAASQFSLPSTLHPLDLENQNEDLPTTDRKSVKTPDGQYSLEPMQTIDEKQMLNKLQLLQNRVYFIERALARRQSRDRLLFTCLFGCAIIQMIFSLRRSILN